ILLAIRPDIRDGLSYDSGIGLKIPEHLSRFRVHRFEVAVHGSVEGDVSRGDDGPTPGGEVFLDAPDFFFRNGVPCHELATEAARPAVHSLIHAQEGG